MRLPLPRLVHAGLGQHLAPGRGEKPVRSSPEATAIPARHQPLSFQHRHRARVGVAAEALRVGSTGAQSIEAALGDRGGDRGHDVELPLKDGQEQPDWKGADRLRDQVAAMPVERRKSPTLAELQRMPAGDRGPRLRTLIALYESRIEGANSPMQAKLRTNIRRVIEVGQLAGVTDLNER